MGWRGVMRSAIAVSRQVERENERQRRYQQKIQNMEDALQILAEYEAVVRGYTTLHQSCLTEEIDWHAVKNTLKPRKPDHTTEQEHRALNRLNTYRPGLLAKLFRQVEAQKTKRQRAVEKAKLEDEYANRQAVRDWENACKAWKTKRDLADRILALEDDAINEVFERYAKLKQDDGDISDVGCKIEWQLDRVQPANVDLYLHGPGLLPNFRVTVLKSGRVSMKDMPKTHFHSMRQDYICSSVIRLAREAFAFLPLNEITITALDEQINTATGHMEWQPVLSVRIPKATLKKLNLNQIDPSDAMANFVHNMDFKKTVGLKPVQRLIPVKEN